MSADGLGVLPREFSLVELVINAVDHFLTVFLSQVGMLRMQIVLIKQHLLTRLRHGSMLPRPRRISYLFRRRRIIQRLLRVGQHKT